MTYMCFRTSSWAGCVLDFWWLPLYELHLYSSTWSEAEALSEYGVVTEYIVLFTYVMNQSCNSITGLHAMRELI
jgi:hypothetical protein